MLLDGFKILIANRHGAPGAFGHFGHGVAGTQYPGMLQRLINKGMERLVVFLNR